MAGNHSGAWMIRADPRGNTLRRECIVEHASQDAPKVIAHKKFFSWLICGPYYQPSCISWLPL